MNAKPTQPETHLRVLLADDDADFVASMSEILEMEDCPVASARTLSEALTRADEFKPDLALIDIRLGAESGLELVARLCDRYPDLMCVVVTAFADTDTAIRALKSGVYDYLRKPFDTSDLFAVLRRCRDRKKLLEAKKASDDALLESEERFRVAFQTSPDAIVLAYAGGEIIDVNPGFERLTGYRKADVVGKNSQEIGLWQNPDERIRLLDMLGRLGQVNNFESDFRLFDGQVRSGLVSARLVQLHGEQVGLFVVRDIHDLKVKEMAIMESEERFRSLISHIPGAVYRCRMDADWTMQYISSPIRDISGYPPTDFVDNRIRSFASIIHSDDKDLIAEAVAFTVSQKKPYTIEYRIMHADGSIRWCRESGRAIYGANGSVEWLDGVIFDITRKKQYENDLAESEKQLQGLIHEYSAVLEGIPDAIMLIDSENRLVWGNRGVARNFSLEEDNIAGKRITDIWGTAADEILRGIAAIFNTAEPVEAFIKSDEGKSWGLKMFPVKNDREAVANVILIASDLTEKVRLREQATRSAHLAALGELAAGVAHEINNPTGMILIDMPIVRDAFNDMIPLLEKHAPQIADQKVAGLPFSRLCRELPDVIDEVEEGAQRIRRIVEELKDFSRPASGVQEMVDLNAVVQKAVSLTRNTLKKSTDRFEEHYADQELLCKGNAQRLEQVMVNLLLNACQALPDRTHGISVRTSFSESRKKICVYVRDDGVGIAPETLSQITDPFFTTRREVGGTGLGLSVSSRILDEHNGTMTFESDPGSGTTVIVELPSEPQERGDA